jgi:hypothetical protein
MQEVNPHLELYTPKAEIAALKKKFNAYIKVIEPFNRKRGRNESLREYWNRLLKDEDSDVLEVGYQLILVTLIFTSLIQALAFKIFSSMPVSMVDEREM